MKKFFIIIAMALLGTGAMAQAQTYSRAGNTSAAVKKTGTGNTSSSAQKTKYMYLDSDGHERPIWIGKTGSCFVVRISKKTGKEYRKYLGAEISAQICKELGRAYEPKNKNK